MSCSDCIIEGDAEVELKQLESTSIDLVVTDPPYGLEFMGKDWDEAVPHVDVWKECLRVLKPGAFAFVMSSPRLDCLSQMAIRLGEAGFNVGFTPIYWAYASGFPKAMNVSKAVDKKLGIEREVLGTRKIMIDKPPLNPKDGWNQNNMTTEIKITEPASNEAKVLDGSYGGFQPKPAVEVIIVAMKPLSEKTYVDQALKKGKGVTWLDDARIPFELESDKTSRPNSLGAKYEEGEHVYGKGIGYGVPMLLEKGRFPANLICSDNALDDGATSGPHGSINDAGPRNNRIYGEDKNARGSFVAYADSGSFSRYFDLDAWWTKKLNELPDEVRRVFPFLIVPKASKSERNEGLESLGEKDMRFFRTQAGAGHPTGISLTYPDGSPRPQSNKQRNFHPTVKPLKLMSYLITLGSRKGDVVLDPFIGSGTTALAARILERHYVGIELNQEYANLAKARLTGTPFLDFTS